MQVVSLQRRSGLSRSLFTVRRPDRGAHQTAATLAGTATSSPLPSRTAAPFLSEEDEHRLAVRWHELGDSSALHRLIVAYTPLVKRIALEHRFSGLALEDILQEGYLGLTIAVRRFDPYRNVRIGTYAAHWIRACMLETIVRESGPVRIGTTHEQRRIFFGLSTARRQLEQSATPVTAENLSKLLRADVDQVESMTIRLAHADVCLDSHASDGAGAAGRKAEVEWLVSSLNASADRDRQPTPEEMVADNRDAAWRTQELYRSLAHLTERERTIVSQRYMQSPAATLAELGTTFRVSQERIRQIEVAALEKLRACLPRELAAA